METAGILKSFAIETIIYDLQFCYFGGIGIISYRAMFSQEETIYVSDV